MCQYSPTNISYSISGGGTELQYQVFPLEYQEALVQAPSQLLELQQWNFSYTVTTTGSCVQVTATGSISVSPDAVITLTPPQAQIIKPDALI
jgi:hypothetical protein